MNKVKNSMIVFAMGVILSIGLVNLNVDILTVKAKSLNSTVEKTNNIISHLENSLKRNYLGSKNLPMFNSYLNNAKALNNKLANGNEKASFKKRIAEAERIIRGTESVVLLETSLDRNYHGMKNIPIFKTCLNNSTTQVSLINTVVCKYKLAERNYINFNIIRDIECINSNEYKVAAYKYVEARKLYRVANKSRIQEDKEKALKEATEALDFSWKISTSQAKEYLVGDIKLLIKNINNIYDVKTKQNKDVNNTEDIIKPTSEKINIGDNVEKIQN